MQGGQLLKALGVKLRTSSWYSIDYSDTQC